MTKATKDKFEFKTEIKQILDLVIHSLYSHKDIFLRELISNAADAIDKLRFESLTDKKLAHEGKEWKIKLTPDAKKKTLTISDNGIGMSKEELIENLGTIAKSGTKEFLEQLKKSKGNIDLIGQFGVGFYSAFMVADKITVVSKKAGSEQAYQWSSSGEAGFEVTEAQKEVRGTDITLHLNDDHQKYLEEWELRSLVKKYSDFVEHPVVMDVEREEPDESAKKEDEKEPKMKKVIKEETLNSQKAIWNKDKKQVSVQEYNDFYKHVSHDYEDPFEVIHYAAEGTHEFKALLYIPKKAPYDIFMRESIKGIQLYVKRIFIMDDCKELIPEYLRFLKGVVESNDLPLNVSRELIQNNVGLQSIKKNLVSKILKTLKNMLGKERERYLQFYKEFGQVLKEGVHYDFENKQLISDLLLFQTSKTNNEQYKTLKEYQEDMPKDQKDIYYLLSADKDKALNSPHLEVFKKKGYEVILMTDPIDEWLVSSLFEYKGNSFKSVDQSDLDLDEDKDEKSSKEKEKKQKDLGQLVGFIKAQLADQVEDVKLSNKLTDSVSVLAAGKNSMPENMKQMMKSMGQEVPEDKKVLEINPDHPVTELLKNSFEENKDSTELKDYIGLIYDQAVIADGGTPKNPAAFAKKIGELIIKASKS